MCRQHITGVAVSKQQKKPAPKWHQYALALSERRWEMGSKTDNKGRDGHGRTDAARAAKTSLPSVARRLASLRPFWLRCYIARHGCHSLTPHNKFSEPWKRKRCFDCRTYSVLRIQHLSGAALEADGSPRQLPCYCYSLRCVLVLTASGTSSLELGCRLASRLQRR